MQPALSRGAVGCCCFFFFFPVCVCLCVCVHVEGFFCMDNAEHNAELGEQYLTKQPRWSSDVIKALHQGVLLLGAGSRSFLLLFFFFTIQPPHPQVSHTRNHPPPPPTHTLPFSSHTFRKRAPAVRSNAIRTCSEFHLIPCAGASRHTSSRGIWTGTKALLISRGGRKKRRGRGGGGAAF